MLIGVGLFSSAEKVNAQTTTPTETIGDCLITIKTSFGTQYAQYTTRTKDQISCTAQAEADLEAAPFLSVGANGTATGVWTPVSKENSNAGTGTQKSAFENEIKNQKCELLDLSLGCFVKILYYLVYLPSTLFLWLSAVFFNALMPLSLSNKLFADSEFIPAAWGVVRDLSNIFFILILLYIAIRMILGLAGHGVKEMIAKVIIAALLINFSMFFTQIIIDSSNILALVFYNKLDVTTKGPDGRERDYQGSTDNLTGITEKDIAGGMYHAFNPTKLLDEEFFLEAKTINIPGYAPGTMSEVPSGILIGVILVSGVIMFFAAYCFFIAGVSFVGRLIELWILIIVSPFAFMSSALPKLASIESWGWEAWLKRVLTSAFMAPIFMFLLYFIFLLINADLFKNLKEKPDQNLAVRFLLILIPTMIILTILRKAIKFAKEASGKYTEEVFAAAKVAGGLGLAAVSGGTAMALKATAGRAGAGVAESAALKRAESKGGLVGFGAAKLRDLGKIGGTASFDIRGAKIGGKTLGSATGMKVGDAQKGGFVKAKEEQITKRQKRAKELEVSEDEKVKQNLNMVEEDLQNLLRANSAELQEIDRIIEAKTKASKTAAAAYGTNSEEARKAGMVVQNWRNRRSALKDSKDYKGDIEVKLVKETVTKRDKDGKEYKEEVEKIVTTQTEKNAKSYSNNNLGTYKDAEGNEKKKSINYYEDEAIPHAHHAVEEENKNRKWEYAKSQQAGGSRFVGYVLSGGAYTKKASREATHNIRTEAKIKDVGKGGGHSAPVAHAAPKAEKADNNDKGDTGSAPAVDHAH